MNIDEKKSTFCHICVLTKLTMILAHVNILKSLTQVSIQHVKLYRIFILLKAKFDFQLVVCAYN